MMRKVWQAIKDSLTLVLAFFVVMLVYAIARLTGDYDDRDDFKDEMAFRHREHV